MAGLFITSASSSEENLCNWWVNLLNPKFLKEELDSEYAFIYRASVFIV